MTPLAMMLAQKELGGPGEDWAEIGASISSDFHCFDVSAIGKPICDAMDADNLWPDMVTMLPRLFLPSPVTWLEASIDNRTGRFAYILRDEGDDYFSLSMAIERNGIFTLPLCQFRGCTVLENPERIEFEVAECLLEKRVERPMLLARDATPGVEPAVNLAEMRERLAGRERFLSFQSEAKRKDISSLETALALRTEGAIKFGLVFSVLAIDLINTPGLIGLRQRDPHRGMAKRFSALRTGNYPLRGWSEVTLKHETKVAGETAQMTGPAFHKCLHFVRSHLRHYRTGKVSVIPAHWRGDPALGIKRTRYRMAA